MPRAQIRGKALAAAEQIIERCNVGVRDVADVNEIADRTTVHGWIIEAKDLNPAATAQSGIHNQWYDVRFRLMKFS